MVLREVEVASPTERDRRRRRDGPQNAETINALMALGDRAVFGRGNADRWTGEPYDDPSSASPGGEQGRRAAAWAATQLGQGVDDTTAEPACA